MDERLTVIEPPKKWRGLDLEELWSYRELIRALIERDLKVRYAQTALGLSWAIIQPLMTMIVFSIFFGSFAGIPSDGVPYPIFVYVALLPWIFFSNSVALASTSLITSAQVVSKIYFPRLIVPVATILAGLVDFAVASGVLVLMMIYYGIALSANLLVVPVLLLGVLMAAIGLGTLLCALVVVYRDIRHVVPFLLQLGMFVTPVAYPASIVPEAWRWAYHLNPMVGLIEGFRAAFLDRPLNAWGIAGSFVALSVLFVAGIVYFEKVERRISDII